jgi:hypothetical protein
MDGDSRKKQSATVSALKAIVWFNVRFDRQEPRFLTKSRVFSFPRTCPPE